MPKKTVQEPSFEEALLQLEELVQKLETGELSLEEAMKLYEQGVQLTSLCNGRLKSAKLKMEELKKTQHEE